MDDIEPLIEVLNQKYHKHSLDEYVEADIAFHRTLISYTQNPMIIQINNMIVDLRRESLYKMFCYPDIVDDAYVAHKRILAALRAADMNECILAVSSHIETTQVHAERLG